MIPDHPIAEHPYGPDVRPQLTWPETWDRLAASDPYWLSTVHPAGRPHLVPVLAVSLDDLPTLYIAANAGSRKARNLAPAADCVIATNTASVDLVVEGNAARVTDPARLAALAAAYAAKYDWQVTVQDGSFHGEGAPTAGGPPFLLFAITPATLFAFGTDETANATRWRFPGATPAAAHA